MEEADWPKGLEGLYFGDDDEEYLGTEFNQPLAGMTWPASLKHLSAGRAFDQELEGSDWPDGLQVPKLIASALVSSPFVRCIYAFAQEGEK